MNLNNKIPCSIIRSGTSKGVFFLEKDLPEPGRIKKSDPFRSYGKP